MCHVVLDRSAFLQLQDHRQLHAHTKSSVGAPNQCDASIQHTGICYNTLVVCSAESFPFMSEVLKIADGVTGGFENHAASDNLL